DCRQFLRQAPRIDSCLSGKVERSEMPPRPTSPFDRGPAEAPLLAPISVPPMLQQSVGAARKKQPILPISSRRVFRQRHSIRQALIQASIASSAIAKERPMEGSKRNRDRIRFGRPNVKWLRSLPRDERNQSHAPRRR